jgi:hypothetical protein
MRPYAKMTCPVPGCSHWLATTEGSVPGVKRHVLAIHGRKVANGIVWPDIHPPLASTRIAEALMRSAETGEKVAQLLEDG